MTASPSCNSCGAPCGVARRLEASLQADLEGLTVEFTLDGPVGGALTVVQRRIGDVLNIEIHLDIFPHGVVRAEIHRSTRFRVDIERGRGTNREDAPRDVVGTDARAQAVQLLEECGIDGVLGGGR